jgi:hypothetical protein
MHGQIILSTLRYMDPSALYGSVYVGKNYGTMEITSIVVIRTSYLLELAYPSMLHAKSKLVELTTRVREITTSGKPRTKMLSATISTAEHNRKFWYRRPFTHAASQNVLKKYMIIST